MAKRTPVAFGLRRQLEVLKEYGYQVVTVEELTKESPFADVGRDDPLFDKLLELESIRAVAYSDNLVRLEDTMTWGELAMLLAPKQDAVERRLALIRCSGKGCSAYAGAMEYCRERGILAADVREKEPVTALPEAYFEPTQGFSRRQVYGACRIEMLP